MILPSSVPPESKVQTPEKFVEENEDVSVSVELDVEMSSNILGLSSSWNILSKIHGLCSPIQTRRSIDQKKQVHKVEWSSTPKRLQ
jgi:hypothetical protein